MAYLLQPGTFSSLTSVKDIQKLMKQDLKNAAKNSHGKDVMFFAAKDVPVGPVKTSIFVITDKAQDWKDWEAAIKAKKPAEMVKGTCAIMASADKKTTEVLIKKVAGNRKTAVGLVQIATQKDPLFAAHDADVIADKNAAAAFKPAATPGKKDAATMARESYEQAQKEGKIDRPFQADAATINRIARLSHQYAEYRKFEESFGGFAKKYNIAASEKEIAKVWDSLLEGLAKSNYLDQFIPKGADKFNIFGEKTEGKVAREALLKVAMSGLDKFIGHAGNYLDKVVAELKKAGGKPTWSFWSGRPADEAAQRENPGGVVLEGSVGAWFEKVWNFTPLSGVNNMAVWTSLSELYAKKAAQYYGEFNFVGYVGPGSTREQSVFNMIEQPTLIEVLNAKERVDAPNVQWYVVTAKNENGKWVLDGPSTKVADRQAALDEVKVRFGG